MVACENAKGAVAVAVRAEVKEMAGWAAKTVAEVNAVGSVAEATAKAMAAAARAVAKRSANESTVLEGGSAAATGRRGAVREDALRAAHLLSLRAVHLLSSRAVRSSRRAPPLHAITTGCSHLRGARTQLGVATGATAPCTSRRLRLARRRFSRARSILMRYAAAQVGSCTHAVVARTNAISGAAVADAATAADAVAAAAVAAALATSRRQVCGVRSHDGVGSGGKWKHTMGARHEVRPQRSHRRSSACCARSRRRAARCRMRAPRSRIWLATISAACWAGLWSHVGGSRQGSGCGGSVGDGSGVGGGETGDDGAKVDLVDEAVARLGDGRVRDECGRSQGLGIETHVEPGPTQDASTTIGRLSGDCVGTNAAPTMAPRS